MSEYIGNVYVRLVRKVRADNAEDARIRIRGLVLREVQGGHIVLQETLEMNSEKGREALSLAPAGSPV